MIPEEMPLGVVEGTVSPEELQNFVDGLAEGGVPLTIPKAPPKMPEGEVILTPRKPTPSPAKKVVRKK